jgi:DNA-binding FadR family transcriptional regulator
MGRSPRALSTEQASVADVLELRSAAEIRAAELAAIHRKSGHVEALRKAIEGMRQTVNDPDRLPASTGRLRTRTTLTVNL